MIMSAVSTDRSKCWQCGLINYTACMQNVEGSYTLVMQMEERKQKSNPVMQRVYRLLIRKKEQETYKKKRYRREKKYSEKKKVIKQ